MQSARIEVINKVVNRVFNNENNFDLAVYTTTSNQSIIIGPSNLATGLSPLIVNSNIAVSTDIIPYTNNLYDLGTTATRFRNLFLNGNVNASQLLTNNITRIDATGSMSNVTLTDTTVSVDTSVIKTGTLPVLRGGTGTTTSTGTGSVVLNNAPTFTGIVTAATVNATTLQQGGTPLSGLFASSSHTHSATQISGILPVLNGGTGTTTSTGSGNVVLSASPTLTGNTTASNITASGNLKHNNPYYYGRPAEAITLTTGLVRIDFNNIQQTNYPTNYANKSWTVPVTGLYEIGMQILGNSGEDISIVLMINEAALPNAYANQYTGGSTKNVQAALHRLEFLNMNQRISLGVQTTGSGSKIVAQVGYVIIKMIS